MFIDTHSHLNFDAFKNDADDVIRRALADNVWVIIVGSDRKTSQKALKIANKYQVGVYAAVGLHPVHLDSRAVEGPDYKFNPRVEVFSRDVYEKMAKFEKVVAVGEIGLDYYRLDENLNIDLIKKKQKEVFLSQLKIARLEDLPVIIHCRDAHNDMLELITTFKKENKELFLTKPWGVVHCFSGDENLAWKYFSLGLLVSFTGIITFTDQYDNLLRRIPNSKFMIETDAPYLTPVPYRGKRNEPLLVKNIAKKIAEVKSINLDRVEEVTTGNARKLFRI